MDRRELLAWVGLGATGLFAAGTGESRGADDQEHEHDHAHDEHLKTLGECVKACNEAAHHCLEHLKKDSTDNRAHHAKAHELTMDCQAFCVLAATLMARSSPLSQYAHQACAEACRCCAEECEKGQGEVMKDCVSKCRACEQMCRRMAGSGAAPVKTSSR